MKENKITIIHGDLVDAPVPEKLRVRKGAYLIAQGDTIREITDTLPETYSGCEVTELGNGLLIPAFSDLHVHMSQYAQRGIGMDKLLADWLSDYTFPQEARFESTVYAEAMYKKALDDMLAQGTFHAAMFTTIHRESCDTLFDMVEKSGMQARIGKVNMDANCPDYLRESTEEALKETERFVADHIGEKDVKPILTPRFAPTVSRKLMEGLGRIGCRYGVGVQTHLVESLWEAEEAKRCFPGCACDAQIYEDCGLLGNGPALFAHFIFPSGKDIELMKKYNGIAVHCPEATTNVIAGIMPAEKLMHADGVRVALGTDVGSAGRPAVYRQIAWTVQLSKQRSFYFPEESGTLSFPEAFYMAVTEGGRAFDRVGLFESGRRLDALALDGLEDDAFPTEPEDRLERFCYCGDDRNIVKRWLNGVCL